MSATAHLADLHARAAALGVPRYRMLRREQLADEIASAERSGASEAGVEEPGVAEPEAEPAAAEFGFAEPEEAEPATAEPGVAEPATAEPGVAEPEEVGPATAEAAFAESEEAEPAAAEAAFAESEEPAEVEVEEPGVAEPEAEPAVAEPAFAEPAKPAEAVAPPPLEEADTDELEQIAADATVTRKPREAPVEPGLRGRRAAEVRDREQAEPVNGVLEVTRQRYGFLRLTGLAPDPNDVYVSASQIRRCELRPGDEVAGPARAPRRGERHRALVHVDTVNGVEPLEPRADFDQLAAVLPERRVALDGWRDDILARAVDVLAPLALGQRMLVRAAPRSGRTTLLRSLARALAVADARVTVLLIDERPEEATAWREAVPTAEFAIATAESAPADQVLVAELAVERARRLAEGGTDAALVCDSLSRLCLAAGDTVAVKRLFGSGRNLSTSGSLTVVATTVAGSRDDGEAERAVITTESSLVTLAPELAADGIRPALRVAECRLSNEEAVRDAAELDAVRRLRSLLADLDARQAAALLRERIDATASSSELLADL